MESYWKMSKDATVGRMMDEELHVTTTKGDTHLLARYSSKGSLMGIHHYMVTRLATPPSSKFSLVVLGLRSMYILLPPSLHL